jgi:hypothetical protein
MTTRTIPLAPGVPFFRQRVTLDGAEYVLVLRWSQREEQWYLDLRDANGVLLVGSIKLVVNWPLLYRFRSIVGVPPGELMVVDGRAQAVDPGLAELGDVAQLVYLDAAELATQAAAALVASTDGV